MNESMCRVQRGSFAVSYTHLDVYKRQVENYAYRPHFILDGVGCIPPQA